MVPKAKKYCFEGIALKPHPLKSIFLSRLVYVNGKKLPTGYVNLAINVNTICL